MSSSDFRHITVGGEPARAERLFRAAVSAFCSLTRPSRREIAQLEDLALPLLDRVSVEARRYVAAALSECRHAPMALVRRLADEPVDVAAPLLIRSQALTDVDLIALIGRHGASHARAIARRPGLNPVLVRLVEAIESRSAVPVAPAVPPHAPLAAEPVQDAAPMQPQPAQTAVPGEAAENARRQLRAMMRPSGSGLAGIPAYAKLRDTALTGHRAFFQTALADALDIDFSVAGRIVASSSYASLCAAMKVLDLSAEQAFLVAAAVFPQHFGHPEGIRLFLTQYQTLHPEAALEKARAWKADAIAAALDSAPRMRSAPLQDNAAPRTRFDLRVRA